MTSRKKWMEEDALFNYAVYLYGQYDEVATMPPYAFARFSGVVDAMTIQITGVEPPDLVVRQRIIEQVREEYQARKSDVGYSAV